MAIINQIRADNIEVEIAYALPVLQVLRKIKVPIGTTLEQAVQISGVMNLFPEIDLNKNRLGIFSQFAKRETILQSCDRVEIYRPLSVDPKEARRLRVPKK